MMSPVQDIAQAVAELWQTPVQLGDDALFFLDSTFGITSAKDLETAFEDDTFCDLEMILEMLLFPDQQTRLALETRLNWEGLSQKDLDKICAILFEKHSTLRFSHFQWTAPVHLPISLDQIRLFVVRLYVDRSIDPDLCHVLETCRCGNEVLACRVMLRCWSGKLNESSKQLLILFVEQVNESHPPFLDLFEMMVTILSQAPESSDPAAVLIAKRQQEKKQLERIRAFEEKKDRYSMEYLMMQRYPVPLDSFENVFYRLEKLDTIINDILGLKVLLDPMAPRSRDLGRFDPEKDMKNIIRLLS